ncbi:MAG: flippase [Patescibacteria group bacterium]
MKKKVYIKNIAWLLADKGINIFGGLLVGVWVARYLGPTDYGVLNYAIAFAAFFSFFSRLGLNEIVVRELSKKPEKQHEIISTAFFMKLFGSVVAVILIMFILFLTNSGDKVLLVATFFIALGYIVKSLDVVDYYYQAKVLSKYVVVSRNIAYLITISLQVFFILKEFSVEYFALASFFMFVIYLKREKGIKKWTFNKQLAKKLFKYSWPLMISTFLILIHMRVDQVMIGAFLGKAELGIYSVSVRLVELWYIIPTLLVSTLMPYFIRIREINKKLYNLRLVQFYSIMFWMGIFVGVGALLFGQQLIILLYGEAYQGAYKALVFNIWAIIFVSQALARSIWIIAENHQKYRLYNNIIAVIVNIVLNIVLIPKMGISGAAIATFLTQFLGTWLFTLLFKPIRKSTFSLMKSVYPGFLFVSKKKIKNIT